MTLLCYDFRVKTLALISTLDFELKDISPTSKTMIMEKNNS